MNLRREGKGKLLQEGITVQGPTLFVCCQRGSCSWERARPVFHVYFRVRKPIRQGARTAEVLSLSVPAPTCFLWQSVGGFPVKPTEGPRRPELGSGLGPTCCCCGAGVREAFGVEASAQNFLQIWAKISLKFKTTWLIPSPRNPHVPAWPRTRPREKTHQQTLPAARQIPQSYFCEMRNVISSQKTLSLYSISYRKCADFTETRLTPTQAQQHSLYLPW